MKECKKSVGGLANFDMFIRLKAEGKLDCILIHPETPFTVCTRNAVLTGEFSSPPHDDHSVNVHPDFKK